MMFGGPTSVLNVCYIFLAWIIYTNCYHHTTKRALLFPEAFVLQLTCCIAVPGNIPNRTLALNMCMQSNFNAPSNISQYKPAMIKARTLSDYDFDRNTLYTYIVHILSGYGLEESKECLLRSICEAAQIPMYISHPHSLLENILHYILTPSLNNNENSNHIGEFYRAEYIGKSNENCAEQYNNCFISLLDLITVKLK